MKQNKKKYIFIVQVTRQLSIDILNSFVAEGAEIELVTGVVESNYEALDPSIKVTKFNKYDNTSGFKRMFTWSLFTFLCYFYVLFRSKKRELIIITTPPFVVFIGSFFHRLRKQNYHLIIWDLYPDVLVNFGVLKETSWLLKRWKKMNRSCFSRAKNIFTLGEHLSKAILTYTDKSPVIIYNWVNSEFVKPMMKSENAFAEKHGLTDKLVVMYSGNLGMTHDIESIIHTADYLKDNPRIQFVIIGDGAKKAKIKQYVQEKNLSNVLILPYQDKEVLPYSLSCADIGVVTLSQGAEMISVPSKTYYTLAAGAAVLALASRESELGLLIENHQCGIVFEEPKIPEIAEFIENLLEDSEKLRTYKENARKASFNYTPDNAKCYYDYIYGKNS